MAISLEEFRKFIEENKGKRKFKQSIELAINFKNVDFTKQDERLNLDVLLPNAKGKSKKLAVFANDKALIEDAKKNSIDVIEGSEFEAVKGDPKRLNALLSYDLVAQQALMPSIAKSFGQFLGPRGKMPRPLPPNAKLGAMQGELSRRIQLRSKGKYLPTVHSIVGSEDMEPEKVYQNINEVLGALSKKLGQNRLKSAYVKMTMSKPVKFM